MTVNSTEHFWWCVNTDSVHGFVATGNNAICQCSPHDDIIKWKHFPRYWSFVWGIHWSPVNSPHKGQWRGALMFSLISAWINGYVNNREAGHLECHHAHYDVAVSPYGVTRPQWVSPCCAEIMKHGNIFAFSIICHYTIIFLSYSV